MPKRTMFYVIRFNIQSEEFEAIAAFSDRNEADSLMQAEKEAGAISPTVMEMTWTEFVAFAQRSIADAASKVHQTA